MNVRLTYESTFTAGTWFDEELIMSNYTVKLKMLTHTMDPADQNIALERIKHFLYEMHSTVFINQTDVEQAEAFSAVGLRVTTLPEEPVDQIVGITLYHKLNAIMEGRLSITELSISSDAGDGIVYHHSQEEHSDIFAGAGWWHEATVEHDNFEVESEGDNVIALDALDAWRELELGWNNTDVVTDIGNVVFANFTSNETKH